MQMRAQKAIKAKHIHPKGRNKNRQCFFVKIAIPCQFFIMAFDNSFSSSLVSKLSKICMEMMG